MKYKDMTVADAKKLAVVLQELAIDLALKAEAVRHAVEDKGQSGAYTYFPVNLPELGVAVRIRIGES